MQSNIFQIKTITGKNTFSYSQIGPTLVWLVWKWLAKITTIFFYLVTISKEIDCGIKEWRTKEYKLNPQKIIRYGIEECESVFNQQ